MTYVDGFLLAVPIANKGAYRAHAEQGAALMRDLGATRLVEGWGDDVPRGEVNDLWRAVEATPDETVLFSWIEYPDKAARDVAVARMMDDPRMAEMAASMPFDGTRMIFGGFDTIVDERTSGAPGYIDGFVLPVPSADKAAFLALASSAAGVFCNHGARRVVAAWADDVPIGEVTDFLRATHATEDEAIVFSWIEWPDKTTRDAGMAAAKQDPRRLAPSADPAPADPPFDGRRVIRGGFVPLLDAQDR